MKPILSALISIFCFNLLLGQSESEVIRIRLDWTNAEQCGLEGCKPQNIVLNDGGSVFFGWPDREELGFFDLHASRTQDTINVKFIKLEENESKEMVEIERAELTQASGETVSLKLDRFEFLVTATIEKARKKKE